MNSPKGGPSNRRFEWYKLLIPALVAISIAFISPFLPSIFSSESPRFALVDVYVQPSAGITFIANNEQANRNADLEITIDEYGPFLVSAIETDSANLWYWNCASANLPPTVLNEGPHLLRVGFQSHNMTDTLHVYFSSTAPTTFGRFSRMQPTHQGRRFSGGAMGKLATQNESIKIEMVFHNGDQLQVQQIPWRRIYDSNSQSNYFEFGTVLQGLPTIDENDPNYDSRFLLFRMTDMFGIEYYQEWTYAQFVAPGPIKFGVTDKGGFRISKGKENPAKQSNRGQELPVNVTFTLPGSDMANTYLETGKIALELEVYVGAGNVATLNWHSNITESEQYDRPVTTVLRNDEPIGISFSDEYIDRKPNPEESATYRIQQSGKSGKLYSSLEALPVRKSSGPLEDYLSGITYTVKFRIDDSEIEEEYGIGADWELSIDGQDYNYLPSPVQLSHGQHHYDLHIWKPPGREVGTFYVESDTTIIIVAVP